MPYLFCAASFSRRKEYCNLSDKMARFGSLTNTYVDQLIENKDSTSTKNAVKKAVRIFTEYVQLQPEKPKIDELSAQDLNRHLKLFWANVRTAAGEQYKKSSLQLIKYGLTKYF